MLRTHCQTSGVSLQEQDPYNNVIRTAYEAMAAALGGTQSLHTNALDEAIALPTEFSRPHRAQHPADPAGRDRHHPCRRSAGRQLLRRKPDRRAGRYESLGADRGSRGDGRHDQGRRLRHAQAAIEESAARRQAMIDRGEEVIVGVNKYRWPSRTRSTSSTSTTWQGARSADRPDQCDEAPARNEDACKAALGALTEGAKGGGNLLALAVEAARARATLGEISDCHGSRVFGRYATRSRCRYKGIYGKAPIKPTTAAMPR
jgi:methylmalonyl-CoA mutase